MRANSFFPQDFFAIFALSGQRRWKEPLNKCVIINRVYIPDAVEQMLRNGSFCQVPALIQRIYNE